MLDVEADLRTRFAARAGQPPLGAPRLAPLPAGVVRGLDAGQAAAVAVLAGDRWLVVVEGAAGAGGARGERIAKWLARAGVASRRDAEKLLAEGVVAVNGAVVPGSAVDAQRANDSRSIPVGASLMATGP